MNIQKNTTESQNITQNTTKSQNITQNTTKPSLPIPQSCDHKKTETYIVGGENDPQYMIQCLLCNKIIYHSDYNDDFQ
jgi:hypothetical protein